VRFVSLSPILDYIWKEDFLEDSWSVAGDFNVTIDRAGASFKAKGRGVPAFSQIRHQVSLEQINPAKTYYILINNEFEGTGKFEKTVRLFDANSKEIFSQRIGADTKTNGGTAILDIPGEILARTAEISLLLSHRGTEGNYEWRVKGLYIAK